MYRAAGVELYNEPYRTLDEVLALVDAIDAETVAGLCKTYFNPAAQTLVSLGPKRGMIVSKHRRAVLNYSIRAN